MGRKSKLANGWIVPAPGTEGKIFADDPVSELKDVGDLSTKTLNECGITTVKELLDNWEEKKSLIVTKRIKGNIAESKLNTFVGYAKGAEPSNRPPMTDYTDYDGQPNPFKARYGSSWEINFMRHKSMSKFCCVTHLVDYIYEQTRAKFVGTEYESNFFFYHDALSLMTAKECKKYMEEKGILEHWILPEHGLFSKEHDPGLTAYVGRPVGNSPELMPLDSCLNYDIWIAVLDCIQHTRKLEKDNPKKFSIATPKKGTDAFLRLVDGKYAPGSKRIVEDVRLFPVALMKIIEANGKIVADLCDRKSYGCRAEVLCETSADKQKRQVKRGGKRTAGAPENYIRKPKHPDALEGMRVKVEASKEIFLRMKKEIPVEAGKKVK